MGTTQRSSAAEVRALSGCESLVDHLDGAYTCNFSCIAGVRGELSEQKLQTALSVVEQRHPLLRARIRRRWWGRKEFVAGQGAPIPLKVLNGPPAAWREVARASLEHRDWADEGPRAELTWVRHSEARSTLVMCYQHAIADGISSILVMRDLLDYVASGAREAEPLPSPGINAFAPSWWFTFRRTWSALLMQLVYFFRPWPARLRTALSAQMHDRRVSLDSIQFTPEVSAQLMLRARRDGVGLHGVLCGAIAQATARELGGSVQQRILHPVDLRRHLRELGSDAPPIGDAVGCYAAAVQTDHCIDPEVSLETVAHEVASCVRRQKASGEPLLTATHLGACLVAATRLMTRRLLRWFSENIIFRGTFSLSNVGRVDDFGLQSQYGELEVEHVRLVSAGSVMHAMTAVASSFRKSIDLQVSSVQPFISRSVAERVLADAELRLKAYAAGHTDDTDMAA
jgi:hypothetical protein